MSLWMLRRNYIGNSFANTGYGKVFFNKQLPDLIRAINRVADAIENNKEVIRVLQCYAEWILNFLKDYFYVEFML